MGEWVSCFTVLGRQRCSNDRIHIPRCIDPTPQASRGPDGFLDHGVVAVAFVVRMFGPQLQPRQRFHRTTGHERVVKCVRLLALVVRTPIRLAIHVLPQFSLLRTARKPVEECCRPEVEPGVQAGWHH